MDKLNKLAQEILAEAKTQGADYAQCSVIEEEKKEFNVDGGRFSLMRTLFNRTVAITVLKDQRKGTVSINRFDSDAVKTAVKDAIAAAESGQPDAAWQFEDKPVETEYTEGAPECDTDKLFERTKELLETIKVKHPTIIMEQMITVHTSWKIVYMTSNNVIYRSKSGNYHFDLMYSAHEGEKGTSFFGSGVTLKDLDKPVIETGLISGVVLSTIMSNFVSDMCLIDGTSIWKDKLDEQVADPRLTISFEPYSDDVVVRERHTGEGYPTENFDLIKDGKLNSFCLSQYGANKTGRTRSGNDGSNIRIKAGEKTLEEIIAGIDKGILVMRFSGGQPASSGEFSGVAKNSFYIENGKIAYALTETMISGCVPSMLMNIKEISKDTLVDGEVSVPYVAFDGVTISGK